jgi:roadblock/LC7 domain-containing protein
VVGCTICDSSSITGINSCEAAKGSTAGTITKTVCADQYYLSAATACTACTSTTLKAGDGSTAVIGKEGMYICVSDATFKKLVEVTCKFGYAA